MNISFGCLSPAHSTSGICTWCSIEGYQPGISNYTYQPSQKSIDLKRIKRYPQSTIKCIYKQDT